MIDGHFFPKSPTAILAAGEQAQVPLMVGWNSEEMNYPGATAEEVERSATDLAGDRFLVYSTWQWADAQRKLGCPVYRYYYAHPRPPMVPEMGNAVAGLAGGVIREPDADAVSMPPAKGVVHAADIEDAMGNLATNEVYAWTTEDEQLSELMQSYYANFVKTGDPNGPGLPAWPRADEGEEMQYMVWDVETQVLVDQHRARYQFHEQLEQS